MCAGRHRSSSRVAALRRGRELLHQRRWGRRRRRPSDGENPWRVGIREPGSASRIATVVAAADAAVATSGAYERGEHIWSGRPRFAERLGSVTIMGPELGVADALATAAFAAGDGAPGWLDRFPEYRPVVL